MIKTRALLIGSLLVSLIRIQRFVENIETEDVSNSQIVCTNLADGIG